MYNQNSGAVLSSPLCGDNQPRLLFRDHRRELSSIFRILDIGALPSNLDDLIGITQPWIMGDHNRPAYEHGTLNKMQDGELRSIFEELNMVNEQIISGREVDDILFCASIFAGALRRSELVTRMVKIENVSPRRIMILSGERRPYPEVEGADIYNTAHELKEKGVKDDLLRQLLDSGVDLVDFWETDIMRLAAMRYMGQLSLIETVYRDEDEVSGGKKLKYMKFDWLGIPVFLHHTLASPRPNGEPRSTTEGSIKDWLHIHTPPPSTQALLVGAQPHIQRMILATQRAVAQGGRDDIDILAAASKIGNIKISIFLGEIARWLWEEQQYNNLNL